MKFNIFTKKESINKDDPIPVDNNYPLMTKKHPSGSKILKKNHNDILKAIDDGMTGTEIAEMFGVSLSSYHGYVRRYIKREHPPKGVKRKSLESMGEVIIRLLNDGKTNSEIQKELGIVDSSLASFIKRHNLKSIRLRNKSYNLENSVIHKNNIADSVVSAESIVDTLIKKITDYEIKIEEQRKALVGFADKVVELDAKLTPLENENKALKEKYNNLLKQTTTQSEQVARLQNILARPS